MDEFRGKYITIMGLGLHGGGIASARFFAKAGAEVTVTDLRDEKTLSPAIHELQGLPIRYVLGRHEIEDFTHADLVIKNPAVRRDSPYLAYAKRIETDISIFLRYSKSPLVAVTGSKGKSTIASAIWHVLFQNNKKALLGGNITVSPLDFLDKTDAQVPVVLELSSWQLGDLRGTGLLKPSVAVLSDILPDHLNYYDSMDAYVSDKRVIYESQDENCWTVCNADQKWGHAFAEETLAQVLWYSERPLEDSVGKNALGGWLTKSKTKSNYSDDSGPSYWSLDLLEGYGRFSLDGQEELLVPSQVLVPGRHQKKNILAAAVAARAFGLSPEGIMSALASFPGVPHRLEFVGSIRGIKWYNDSTATIPDATIAAIDSFSSPIVLIAGGSDKMSDFSAFAQKAKNLKAVILLAGSGTDRLIPILDVNKIAYNGPFFSMHEAVQAADKQADPGDIVILSPGCASFGMFLHEFARGDAFKREALMLFRQYAEQGSTAQKR